MRPRFGLAVLLLACLAAVAQDRVRPIKPPATPLPAEAESTEDVFSFIVYGDTRGRADGSAVQAEHTQVMDAMLATIEEMRDTIFPVRFVLQSGDAVFDGSKVDQWNVSFNPIIERLTAAGVPYYLSPGNHDVSSATAHDAPNRQDGLRNMLDAMSAMMPPDGSPRRLDGYPAYAVAYGNVFALGYDSNLIGEEKQFTWVKSQLEGLDRKRFTHVFVFCHQQVFSSGPHGAANTEEQTMELRNRYMPLFRQHHVTAVFSGHEHLFEHWVERYTDASGTHRMDLVVSGGGGAPPYNFRSLPDTKEYIARYPDAKIQLEQIARPGEKQGDQPYHFLLVRVDGETVDMQFISAGKPYAPYTGSTHAILKGGSGL